MSCNGCLRKFGRLSGTEPGAAVPTLVTATPDLVTIFVHIGLERERERGRERERERASERASERERERERETDKQTDRQTDRLRQTEIQTDRDRHIETASELGVSCRSRLEL